MEHYLEELLRQDIATLTQMRRVKNTNLLLPEHFLQGNVPLKNLLNAKRPFMS